MNNLEQLYQKIKNCEKCRLCKTRENVVCGEGNIDAKLLIVAQAPGAKENENAKMFVGPTGKIFNELLKLAEIKREEIFITNLLKCFLPKYRRPKWDEIYKCRDYLFIEIQIINPKIIAPLGYYSTRVILEYFNFSLPQKRNEYHKIFGKIFKKNHIKILPLPHPALLFHNNHLLLGLYHLYFSQILAYLCIYV